MNPQTEVDAILRKHKAIMVRHKKHEVWRFPDGRTYVQSSTPSDIRAAHNQLRDLRRMLGLGDERGTPGQRRQRKCKPGVARPTSITASASTAMLEAMRKSGLVEDTLNARIGVLRLELQNSRRANSRRRNALREMTRHCKTCWGCRLARWAGKIFRKLTRSGI